MSYDELELDTLGDRKTALFLIMSDTDSTFNFVTSEKPAEKVKEITARLEQGVQAIPVYSAVGKED